MKTRLQGVCGKAEQLDEEDSAKVEIKCRIFPVEFPFDGTGQNKSFRRVAYPPENLREHTRRHYGDVRRILTHKEGEDWGIFSLPRRTCGLCQESLGSGIGIGGGTGPVPSARKTGFAEIAGWCEPASGNTIPRIASDISQISFRTFMVTPFLG